MEALTAEGTLLFCHEVATIRKNLLNDKPNLAERSLDASP